MRGPVPPAAGLGLGLLAGDALGLSAAISVIPLLAGLVLVAAALRDPRSGRSRRLLGPPRIDARPPRRSDRERILEAAGFGVRRPAAPGRARVAAIVAGAALAGSGWLGVREAPSPLPGGEGPFLARATSDPDRTDWGWGLDLRVSVPAGDHGLELDVWASDEGRPQRIVAGDRVMVRGRFEPLGFEGFDAFLRSRGVDAALRPSSVRVLGPTNDPLLRVANAARSALRRGALASLSGREAGLFLGLAIGDIESMDREVEEDFRASGLGHLLAVSGSNVAMFLGPVMALAAAAGLRLRGRVTVGLVGVVVFAMITRWEPSVLRAGAMAGLALAAAWGGRPRSTAQVLGAAVLLLLVWDPTLAASLGFQLSVAATVGLATMAAPLAAGLRWLPRWMALATAATVAAQAAVTPLLLLRFGVVPTVTILANVLAFPAVPPALLLGVVAAFLAAASPLLGRMLGDLAEVPLGYLAGVADATARFTLPSLTSSGPVVPAFIAAAVALLAVTLRRARRGGTGAVVVAAVIGTAAWIVAPTAGPPAGLEVTFLDVGQGDAAVIRGPRGETILVDAGPDEQQVAGELAALGVRRIDLAVASHGHADHVAGFPAVFSRFPVSLMAEPGCPADSPSYRDMVAAARREDVDVRHPRGGDRYDVGSIRVDVLGPDECSPDEPNDDSLVLLLTFGAASVLLPGDAEVPAQQDLLEDEDPVAATVLKVPHHGGDTSDVAFLEAVGADLAVVSSGENDYGHPNEGVLVALRAAGMVVYRTDREGDVTVGFDRSGAPIVEA